MAETGIAGSVEAAGRRRPVDIEPVDGVEPAEAELDRSGDDEAGADAEAAPRRSFAWRPRHQLWLVAAAVLVSALGAWIFGRRYSFFDMRIYHGAMEWWTSGGELYEFIATNTTLGYTYPPFAALVMIPIATVPIAVAGWINIVISVAALSAVLAALLAPIADRYGWPRWLPVAVAVPLALATEPGRETLGFGQVNLLLFALVLADLLALRWAAQRAAARRNLAAATSAAASTAGEWLRRFWLSGAWAGVGVGLATAVKLTPGLFILYFVVSRQWRAAAVASGTAAGATVLAWLMAPRESMQYFTSLLWQTDRVGAIDFAPNQSLAGVLARLYDQPHTPTLLWMSFSAVCLALALSRAISAHKEGDELAAFTLVGLAAVVISPISWTHHLVFVIPAMLIMVDAALRRGSAGRGLGIGSSLAGLRYWLGALATYVLFVISPVWWVRHRIDEGGSHYDSGMLGVLAENSLALGVIVLLVLMPWRPGAEPAFPMVRYDRTGYARRRGQVGILD